VYIGNQPMVKLNLVQTPNEEYLVYKDDLDTTDGPHMMTVPQNYPEEIFVSKGQEPMPIVMKMFVGGLSLVGLYIVYQFMDRHRK
jgi:type IV secretory pathway VirB6-like protein